MSVKEYILVPRQIYDQIIQKASKYDEIHKLHDVNHNKEVVNDNSDVVPDEALFDNHAIDITQDGEIHENYINPEVKVENVTDKHAIDKIVKNKSIDKKKINKIKKKPNVKLSIKKHKKQKKLNESEKLGSFHNSWLIYKT